MALGARVFAVAAAALAIGCGPTAGTDVGNGRTLELQLKAYEEVSLTGAQSLTLESGVFVDSLFVAVDRIRFAPLIGTDCSESGDNEIDIQGPVVANLVGNGVIGGAPVINKSDGFFCKVDLGFHKIDLASPAPAGTPPELDGLSVRMVGERADGTAFVVESELSEGSELEARNNQPFALAPGAHTLFLAYEIGSWITALDLDSLGAGPLVINAAQNSDRLAAFNDAVKASVRLFHDDDGDGELSAGEHVSGSELAD